MSPSIITTSNYVSSIFSVRYERNPYFTGRDDFLKKLSRQLSDRQPKRYNHRVSLHGLGGMGKTQIALEYAYRHKSDYKYVFWISAVDQSQLLSGFVDIAKLSGCVKVTDKSTEVAKCVLDWLRVTESWLLIIDNLDDITIVNDYLPSTSGVGHTLITTRNRNSDGIPADGLEITEMNPEDCVQFLFDRIRLTDHTPEIRNEAHKIVQELGCLPLAIEQAAAYIRTSQNIGEYLITYKKERQELLDWRSTGNYPYNYTVATTLRMSLERLKLSHPNAIALIQYLAFLNPDEISLDFLKDGIEALPSRIQVLIENNLRRVESLNALESFSLIRVFGEGRKISIHRLVQAVIQDDLDSSLQALIISDVIRLGLQSFPDIVSDASKRETCRRYRSQAIACLEKGIVQNTVQNGTYSLHALLLTLKRTVSIRIVYIGGG